MTDNGHLNLFLQDLDERKGRIPCCQEVSLIQSRIRRVIRSILLEVRRENSFFRTTLINSGSFYEGTRSDSQMSLTSSFNSTVFLALRDITFTNFLVLQ